MAALDHTMAELEQSDPGADHERTKAGLGVAMPGASPAFALLRAGRDKIPLEKERELVQPERSPLAFVMGNMEPSAAPQKHVSGDSSKFVTSLVGDQPPPRVEGASPTITAMPPVMRGARRRRHWIAAGALAATAGVCTVLAIKLTGSEETPRPAAAEAAKVTETTSPRAAAVPTPSNIATGPSDPTLAPETPPKTPEAVDITTTSETAAKPSEKPGTAKKRVATKDTAAKKSSTAKKKSTAKTAKKPSTAKKTSTKKSSRSQRSGRRPARSG